MDLRIGKSETQARGKHTSRMSLATSGVRLLQPACLAPRMRATCHYGKSGRMKLPHASATATALTILAATIALPAPARAQTYDPSYPVCLQVYQGMVDYYFECRYQTMAQCAASASGRAAQCVVNPYYGGPKAGRSKRQKRPQPY